MSEPGFLPRSRIAIFGLGLMGGSLALALQRRCQSLLAYDPDPGTIDLAREHGIVDRISADPVEILAETDAVILAAPVRAILALIKKLPALHPGSAIVLDLGSTKSEIVTALETLPDRFDPLGGHPMCGKETGGLASADAGIFKGATFVFTRLARTSKKASAFAEELASAVGSQPLWLDAQRHDRWVAATSHLPYLASAALSLSTPLESAPLVGPGYRSTTRVAATPVSTMLDVLTTNRDNILESLAQFRKQLDLLEEQLSRNEMSILKQSLEKSALRHKQLIRAPS